MSFSMINTTTAGSVLATARLRLVITCRSEVGAPTET